VIDQSCVSFLVHRALGIRRPSGPTPIKRRHHLAGIALMTLLVAGMSVGCGRFSFNPKDRAAYIAEGQRVFVDKGCDGCHTLDSAGPFSAPNLRQTALRYTEAGLTRWLQNPSGQVPTRHMPDLHLSEAEANAVAAYVSSLR
jgi:mono/diheme cytochrome c family protein